MKRNRYCHFDKDGNLHLDGVVCFTGGNDPLKAIEQRLSNIESLLKSNDSPTQAETVVRIDSQGIIHCKGIEATGNISVQELNDE